MKIYQSLLAFLGFEIDAYGGNTFIVRTVPVVLGKHTTPETIYDIIDELVATGKVKSLDEKKDDMLKLLVCHSAIRGGEELSMPKIEKLLEELLTIENLLPAPTGDPLSSSCPQRNWRRSLGGPDYRKKCDGWRNPLAEIAERCENLFWMTPKEALALNTKK